MAQNAPNEVDEIIKQLKQNKGFSAYMIMNNDGIVIKYENMEYKKAVHYASVVLDVYHKARPTLKSLLPEGENEVESIRLRTEVNEIIIAQHGAYTLVVIQAPESKKAVAVKQEGEKVAEEVKETAA